MAAAVGDDAISVKVRTVHGADLRPVGLSFQSSSALHSIATLEDRLRAAKVIGLDTEWVEKRPTALLQLALPNEVIVVRVHETRIFPEALARVLEDPDVLKSGVGISSDAEKLCRDHGVCVRGVVDPRAFAALHLPRSLVKEIGRSLSSLSDSLLGIRHAKDEGIVRSNWEAGLRREALEYAATDAWVSREILLEMFRIHQERVATPPSVPSSPRNFSVPDPDQFARLKELCLPCTDISISLTDRLHHAKVSSSSPDGREVAAILDQCLEDDRLKQSEAMRLGLKHFVTNATKEGRVPRSSTAERPRGADQREVSTSSSPSSSSSKARDPALARLAEKAKRLERMARKKALYDNCVLQGPDGRVLCTISKKKARWYVDRGLGEEVPSVSEDLVVRLNFKPRGTGHADDQYYLSQKTNQCACCGSKDKYLRHHIVPHMYRKLFPETSKSHLSHDVVLLCAKDHQKANTAYHQRMKAIGLQYNAPIEADALKLRVNREKEQVKSYASALLTAGTRLPPDRRTELEGEVRRYYQLEEGATLTPELLKQASERASEMDTRERAEDNRSHAEKVMEQVMQQGEEGIDAFVRGWRRFFVETMQPRYLPPAWSVDARTRNSSA